MLNVCPTDQECTNQRLTEIRTFELAISRGAAWAISNDPILPDAQAIIEQCSNCKLADSTMYISDHCIESTTNNDAYSLYLKCVDTLKNRLNYDRQNTIWKSPHIQTIDDYHYPTSDELYRTEQTLINRALYETCLNCVSAETRHWLLRTDLAGYALSHQILAWSFLNIQCRLHKEDSLFAQHLVRKLYSQIKTIGEDLVYDLFAESIAVLLYAGVPERILGSECKRILREQDSEDGGWYFDYMERNRDPALLLLNEYSYGQITHPPWMLSGCIDRDLYSMQIALRGHSTAVSIWTLRLLIDSRLLTGEQDSHVSTFPDDSI